MPKPPILSSKEGMKLSRDIKEQCIKSYECKSCSMKIDCTKYIPIKEGK